MAGDFKIKKIPAKKISYGAKRNLESILYIPIHYTGNSGDTAKGNGLYFKNGNQRAAGAHFFVDRQGNIVKSVNMNRTAWAVGGFYTKADGAGAYYGKCTNANSVSIELCDCLKEPSRKQIQAVKWLISYIQRKCPNARRIIRHWDVNGKCCPAPFIGKDNKKWEMFKREVQ